MEKLVKFCTNTLSLVEFFSPFPLFGDVWCIAPGIILEGDDILMATMSLAAAKVRCTGLPNCIGFYSEDWPFEGDGPDGDVRAEAGMKSTRMRMVQ